MLPFFMEFNMGIRVHYEMGYGLTDVVKDDPRFNKEIRTIFDNKDDSDEPKSWWQRYMNHLDGLNLEDLNWDSEDDIRMSMIRPYWDEKKDLNTWDIIRHDAEYGMENVVLFIPPSQVKSWRRYDDSIDYYMETINEYGCMGDGGGQNHVKKIELPLYPFDGYMDARNGKRLRSKHGLDNMAINMARNYILSGEEDKFSNYHCNIVMDMVNAGTVEEALEIIVPIIPEELRYLLEYMEVFKDKTTINSLRPMIYCYWG